jgi:hypothetical protein
MNSVGLRGSRKTRGKTRDGHNVRAIPRLTVGKATVAYARQSALGLLPLGGDSRNRGERRASWRSYETAASLGPRKRPGEKSWLTDTERRYHSENATLFFDGADRRGLGGEPIAGSLLAARRGASRFQNRGCGGEDAGRALIGNFLFGF